MQIFGICIGSRNDNMLYFFKYLNNSGVVQGLK